MLDPLPRARVVSVHVGPVQRFDDDTGDSWSGAIGKSALSEPVRVEQHHVTGDEQADRPHHGGPDKTVFAHPSEHHPRRREKMGPSSLGPGAFGENLAVAGPTEHDVCLGDVWDVGEAGLQASQPRRPCWTPARRLERADGRDDDTAGTARTE